MENIETYHNDVVYKDGITGLINIAYDYIYTKKWAEALAWTTRFGQVLSEYEQRPDADADYIDRQLARFDIYNAISLQGLGKADEAAEYLSKVKSCPEKTMDEGLIAYLRGDLDRAIQLVEQARNQGLPQAAQQLEEFRKLKKNNK